jgi:hypothetical protein
MTTRRTSALNSGFGLSKAHTHYHCFLSQKYALEKVLFNKFNFRNYIKIIFWLTLNHFIIGFQIIYMPKIKDSFPIY